MNNFLLSRNGPPPFISRVDNKEKLGINVPKKIIGAKKKKDKKLEYLVGHRKFIEELNNKNKERKEKMNAEKEEMKARDSNVLIMINI